MKVMEASISGHYGAPMPRKPRATAKSTPAQPLVEAKPEYTKAGEIMGQALRLLRKKHAGTQEVFCERTGEGQSSLSEAENGIVGWDTVNKWSAALGRLGADPLDLLRTAAALADLDPTVRELVSGWVTAPDHTKQAILILLRGQTDPPPAKR